MPELTAYQIADAFPDECLEFIPRALKSFGADMYEYKERIKWLMDMSFPDAEKALYRMFINHDVVRDRSKIIKKYEEVLKILKDKNDKSYYEQLNKVARAKARPIETFITLEKQKMGTSRIHGCCPLHDDSKPSFVIYRNTNTYYCFSACKTGGDSIDLFMKLNKVSFNEAIDFLSKG